MIVGNPIGAVVTTPDTFIIVDDHGVEHTALVLEEEVELTATENDIRLGKVAATERGVTNGEKVIPAYHTYEGTKVVPNGSVAKIKPPLEVNAYDYTKLQVIICLFNTNLSDSAAADKISINNNVYNVQSADSMAAVTKDHETKEINLGITNNSGAPWIVRFIMYKEIN